MRVPTLTFVALIVAPPVMAQQCSEEQQEVDVAIVHVYGLLEGQHAGWPGDQRTEADGSLSTPEWSLGVHRFAGNARHGRRRGAVSVVRTVA